MKRILNILLVLTTTFVLLIYVDNKPVYADTSHCGTINSNETWSSSENVHRITCDVIVASGVTLTIEAGAIIKFDLGRSLIINGTLTITGVTDNKVYFTSIKDDTVGGDTNGDGFSVGSRSDWDRIEFTEFSNDASIIDHAVIRYAGTGYSSYYGAIRLFDSSPTIQNTEITENTYCAIEADLHSFPTLTNNNIHDNDANGFCIKSGTLDIDATWDLTDITYYIRNNVTIAVDKTLTVNPDVIVKIASDGEIIVNGTLDVQGTVTNPVYFTSYRDDTVGGDTNGDGSSVGSRSDWDRIEFTEFSNDASIIDHAVIRYAGTGYSSYYGAINLVKASPTIRFSIIEENEFAGIRASESTPILICNNIYNNGSYGLYNATITTRISAENQWWGSSSGPYHETTNPYGSGNGVTDGVYFIPWLTAPCGEVQPEQYMIYLPTILR